jgi:hypothetical protein
VSGRHRYLTPDNKTTKSAPPISPVTDPANLSLFSWRAPLKRFLLDLGRSTGIKHLGSVSIDFLGSWSLPYLANIPSPVLKWTSDDCTSGRAREVTFQNLTRVTIGGNAMCVGLSP